MALATGSSQQPEGPDTDLQQAFNAARLLSAETGRDPAEEIRIGWDRACTIIYQQWAAVVAVADKLQAHRELTREQLRESLERAWVDSS